MRLKWLAITIVAVALAAIGRVQWDVWPPVTHPEPQSVASASGSPSPSPSTSSVVSGYFANQRSPSLLPTAPARFVVWSRSDVVEAQRLGLASSHLLLADTWVARGAVAQDAQTYNGHSLLILDGFARGSTFDAPISGQVGSLSSEVGRGFRLTSVQMIVGHFTVSYYFADDVAVLVKTRDVVEVTAPLARLSGSLIPKGMLFSAAGQVGIANETSFETTLSGNMLRDATGAVVRIQP